MKNQFIFFILILTCHTIYGQKPMIGYTPSEIKERNYLEFSTSFESWEVTDTPDLSEHLLTTTFSIPGILDLAAINYYFKNNSKYNYQCAIFTFNKLQFINFKKSIIDNSTYEYNGWYKYQSADNFYLKFNEHSPDKEGNILYSILYRGELPKT